MSPVNFKGEILIYQMIFQESDSLVSRIMISHTMEVSRIRILRAIKVLQIMILLAVKVSRILILLAIFSVH